MSQLAEPDAVVAGMSNKVTGKTISEGANSNTDFQEVDLVVPEVQRAIIEALESDGIEESLYVYTVSRDWYNRWRLYVGLTSASEPEVIDGTIETKQPKDSEALGASASESNSSSGCDDCNVFKTSPDQSHRTKISQFTPAAARGIQPAHPGPIAMDLSSDDNNISVDEKVNFCLL